MRNTQTGMEIFPGFPDREMQLAYDAQLEHEYPGLRDIFDKFLGLAKAPGDIFNEVYYDRGEFPMEAAIAAPDPISGKLEIVSHADNDTRGHLGSLGHAEHIATERALKGRKHLPEGSVLISNVEPCSYCAGGLHHSGGDIIVFGASQDDIRGDTVWVNGASKPYRTEPKGYTAKQYLTDRNPQAVVRGGYRRSEVLRLI